MRVHHRRLACVWGLAILLLVPAWAGAADGDPRAIVDAAVFDFGTVEQGSVVEHVFRMKNMGPGALRVDHVKSTCACTVGVATGEPVEAGGEAWVTVTLETARLAGRTTKTVTVYTNDPASPALGVTLTGRVLTDLVVTPTPLYVGHVRRGTVVRRTLALASGRDGPAAAVTAAETSNPHVHATIEPEPNGHGQQVTVEISGDMPLGRFNDDLVLRTTSERQPTLSVPVLGIVEGDIAVLPPQVTFGLAQGEHSEPREIFIRNRGARPVTVTKVTSPENVTAELATVEDGVEYRVSLRLRDGLPPGKIEGTIEIFTTHPQESRLVVPLYAIIRPAARHG
jgi:hypothetical protein